jgi:hypothetical protein
MPYLDQGEFYSEFGNFDVTLTLPENYVVGATGTLQTPEEWQFLAQKEIETKAKFLKDPQKMPDDFPASSAKQKTIRYIARNVHDFGWFADKRFMVLKDTARLESGKTVECWAMFTHSQAKYWRKGAVYVKRAVEFYSEKVGEYPWPQATAVHSALSAGGGMEYPMITVIGDASSARDLDDVITHEVGHNWFYGILASDERNHPFMDEGLNTYYESRYMKQYYGDFSPVEVPKWLFNPKVSGSLMENGYLLLARDRQDTPPDSHSDQFTSIGYGLQVYSKPALCMAWLEQSVGTEKLDAAMQDYYQKWKFKHPYPEDMKAVLTANGLAVDWFFDAMQTEKQADYALKKVKKLDTENWELSIKRKGELAAPLAVSAIKDGVSINTQWLNEFGTDHSKLKRIRLKADNPDAFVIDNERVMLDVNRKNNGRRTSGLTPGIEPVQLKMLAAFQNSKRNIIGLTPWLGWNNNDKTMLGLIIYNPPFPYRKLQVYLLPGYAFGSKSLVGLADMRYRFYPGGIFKKMELGIGAKSFSADHNAANESYSRFYRLAPQLNVALASSFSSYQHNINLRTLFIGQQTGSLEGGEDIWKNSIVHEIRYEGKQSSMPRPFQLQMALETQSFKTENHPNASYWKLSGSWRQQFYYNRKKKVTARLFAGYFLKNTLRNEPIAAPYYAFSLNPQGFNDYKFDHTFLARDGGSGILGRQVSQSDGGFKGAFGNTGAAVLGLSNHFALALNLKADIPKWLPLDVLLKPYFDIGYFDDSTPTGNTSAWKEQLMWNGGLMLDIFNGGLEVYFPLVSSAQLRRQYCAQGNGSNNSGLFCGGNYLKMISWSLRLNNLDPVKAIENFVR